ncbi:bifunctional enoyl-CoA hydratase/phosphate acetyltransferase [Desulforamulus ferrireducens]|uniref:Phosphate butyryltransferase n=1 Tax=Desulforamulus ferrireducens TaxID=1833852 RepID=A0A1S6IWT4_9FIRM|nr:bifunctional enoyl-CoA hydratase/phosphate acetyltransferase [Desulforamulus ferrireducens]AQS59235.1 phosphate butyryltransferase [Desulforamulus ferrireducens]
MQYKNFSQILEAVKSLPKLRISVANAQDEKVLAALKIAMQEDFVEPVLVGTRSEIERKAWQVGFDLKDIDIWEADALGAPEVAVKLVRCDFCQVLMKGLVNSSTFLKAVLNGEWGLRTGKTLSHLGVYEIHGFDRLIFLTDGGLNIAPDLETKKQICQNAIDFAHSLGITLPKVAVLSANEQVNPKMPVTLEAQQIAQMAQRGEISGALVDGPLALDIAINKEAAEHKGIKSPVAGQADILLVPNIEAGNLLGKSITYFAGGLMAGVVLGAGAPIVLPSRADTPQGKLLSLALACLAKHGMDNKDKLQRRQIIW